MVKTIDFEFVVLVDRDMSPEHPAPNRKISIFVAEL